MSELIGVVGESGTGKSTACRTLNPKDTAVVNCVGKPLPFKGWKKNYTKFEGKTGNYFASDKTVDILKFMKAVSDNRSEIKNLIIDDWQYTMSNEFMRRSSEKGFEKFTEIGKNAWSTLNAGKALREDLKVFVLTHSDTVPGEFGAKPTIKIKTIGKLLDDKINPAGLFTVLLFTDVETKDSGEVEYRFVTNNDGTYPAKSPMDMFGDKYIPNDLGLVVKTMDEYYG